MGRAIDVDFITMIMRLKMHEGKKSDIFMVDFEKSSEYWTGLGSIIMDAGYNKVDILGALTDEGMTQPGSDFIRGSTGKVVYEVLKNPVFFKEMSNLSRMKKEENTEFYGYFDRLINEKWFSKDMPEAEIAYEFKNLLYLSTKHRLNKIDRNITDHLHSMDVWSGKKTFKEDPTSPARELHAKAERRYELAKQSKGAALLALNQEMKLMSAVKTGNYNTNKKIEKIQINYQLYILNMQTDPNYQLGTASETRFDYDRTWSQDKILFDRIGYGGKIEPWKKIMTDMKKFIETDKNSLLAISAFGTGSEKDDLANTSEFLKTPEFAHMFDKYHEICTQNIINRMETVDPMDVLNLIYAEDEKVMESAIEGIIKNNIGQPVSLQARYRDLKEKPKHSQKHIGQQDAFEQSEVLIEGLRRFVTEEIRREWVTGYGE